MSSRFSQEEHQQLEEYTNTIRENLNELYEKVVEKYPTFNIKLKQQILCVFEHLDYVEMRLESDRRLVNFKT